MVMLFFVPWSSPTKQLLPVSSDQGCPGKSLPHPELLPLRSTFQCPRTGVTQALAWISSVLYTFPQEDLSKKSSAPQGSRAPALDLGSSRTSCRDWMKPVTTTEGWACSANASARPPKSQSGYWNECCTPRPCIGVFRSLAGILRGSPDDGVRPLLEIGERTGNWPCIFLPVDVALHLDWLPVPVLNRLTDGREDTD